MYLKKAVLYYFPYAGASSVSFKNIFDYFSEDIEIEFVEYPGHGKRIEDVFAESVDDIANEVHNKIIERTDDAMIFLSGHCLGAIVALETYKKLNNDKVKKMIISGQGAPDALISEHLQDMSEDELVEYLINNNLMDEQMKNPRLRSFVSDLILKPLISDSIIYDKYKCSFGDQLNIPISILYAKEDTRYGVEQLKEWERFTNKNVDYYPFEGNHYFLRNNEKEYFECINQIILKEIV